MARVKAFNPQDAAIGMWAVATVGITDPHVIVFSQPLRHVWPGWWKNEESTKKFFRCHIKIL